MSPRRRACPASGVGTVAVLQATHALGDGIRSSALAAWLFGREEEVPPVPAPPSFRGAALPWRSFRAARAHRQLVCEVDAGRVPPQADSRPALRSNARPDGVRSVRTVIRNRAQLPGPPVTAGAAAVSTASAGHLRELGDDPSTLGAEVPMAKAGVRQAHNHFGNVGVGLYPELAVGERTARIVEDWRSAVAGPDIPRCLRPAGHSPLCPRRYYAGASGNSTQRCGHRPSSEIPSCPASTAVRPICVR